MDKAYDSGSKGPEFVTRDGLNFFRLFDGYKNNLISS